VTPTEVGAQNFFLSPQSQFRNLKEALLQSQFRDFLKKCCSATATTQSHFFLKSATSRLQLESSTPNNFWPWNPVDSWRKKKKKKHGGQESRATVPLRQVFGSRETDSSKNIFG
jgi:hypothetical protein